MSILLYGILIFIISFLLHLIIWRVHLPGKKHVVILLEIFLGVLAVSLFILKINPSLALGGITPPQSLPDFLKLSLLYISLTLAYITTYSAVEVDSPSLIMVLNIAKTHPGGLERDKLYNLLNDEYLVKPRINNLVNDGLAYKEGEKYKLNPAGSFIAGIFIVFRNLLNAPKGG